MIKILIKDRLYRTTGILCLAVWGVVCCVLAIALAPFALVLMLCDWIEGVVGGGR